MSNHPLIGVMPLWNQTATAVIRKISNYTAAIEQAGGIPLVFPETTNRRTLTSLTGLLDGVLFTGGQDVDPAMYGSTMSPHCNPPVAGRDEMEAIVFNHAVIDKNLPALGICRGTQLINVMLGGTLYQDIPTEIPDTLPHRQTEPPHLPTHKVSVLSGTPLAGLFSDSTLSVNSFHHQSIKKISDKLLPMCYSPDQIIEGVFAPDKDFLWGVQWHPELMPDSTVSQRLFARFIKHCTKVSK